MPEPKGKSDFEKPKDPELADDEKEEPAEAGEEEGPEAVPAHPVCPRCGWSNTRISHTRTMVDMMLQIVSVKAFRCRSCGNRFRTFRRG
jgi:hypothetical protein